MRRFAADFETTTDPEDCRVWAWGVCDIEDPTEFQCGTELADFFRLFEKKSAKVYFHNLRFDGEFILYHLFRNGYAHVRSKEEQETGTFTTLISRLGQWYQIKVCVKKTKTRSVFVTFQDSLKILPMPVSTIAKAFKLPMLKGSLDYSAPRPLGHQLTAEEREYLYNDCTIVARALGILFEQDLTAMTAGSNALADYKERITRERFDKRFPVPHYDADIRQAYRGGFTYLAPRFRNRTVKAGIVLDVNSLYPSVMYYKPMPYGEGLPFVGEYEPDDRYPLFVQMFTCQFRLKPKRIPTVQLKSSYTIFSPTEYLEDSQGRQVCMCMTSVDLALFFEQYDVFDIEYHSGWKFHATTGLFCEYIDKWTTIKTAAKLDGNGGMYTLSKLMLNSLYGKFALNPKVQSKAPIYDIHTDRVHMELLPEETREPVYIPVGCFITSHARDVTIRAAQAVYERFIYADTDSLHLLGTELPVGLEIDPARLGAWKHELTFSTAHYIRSKAYVEVGHEPGSDEPDTLRVTCAGLPEACHPQVTLRNFRPGRTYRGKLVPRHVPGGIVLERGDYSLHNF